MALHLVVALVSLSLQLSCKLPPACGREFLRRFMAEAAAFPIFSIASVLWEPLSVDHMSGPATVVAIVLVAVAGLLNSLLASAIIYGLLKLGLRRWPKLRSVLMPCLVGTVWAASVAMVTSELQRMDLIVVVIASVALVSYVTVRVVEAIFVKATGKPV